MFVYICKRSLVGVRDIPSQFGCSVFGQEDHHGTHDTSSHQAFPACKRDHHSPEMLDGRKCHVFHDDLLDRKQNIQIEKEYLERLPMTFYKYKQTLTS